MTRDQRSALLRLALILTLLLFAGVACSLGGGGDDKDSENRPTVPATITPPSTRTLFPTFTAFPTLTPYQGGGFQPVPTATRISLNPTAIYFPTWTPASVSATPYPYDVRISYPVDGSQVAGYITVVGSASHPRFLQYALEWGPDPNPNNLWYPITSPQVRPIINGGLGAINTTQTADGVYQVRLHIWLNDGTETFDVATGIRISNRAPTAVPTLTPTPRPNRTPTINPIPSQEVNASSTLNQTITTSDPDGDVVNLFVASSNNAVATTLVTSQTAISVTGVTAGTATISVTANDNRGGLATTAFIVTVKGQNRAPAINPILAQAVNVGQTLDVAISVSDPDGDTLTVAAVSDNTAILNVSAPNTSTVQLVGVSVGSANVTVTANDGKGGVINTAFRVDVGQPNRPPTIEPIAAQTMTAGQTLDVIYVALDPDGNTLTAQATSDTPGVVTASVTTPGLIQLTGVSAGTATVTLSVSDTIASATISTFQVTVAAGNSAPTILPIGSQTLNVGQAVNVTYTATDPDGDSLTAQADSDNSGVVTVSVGAPGTITLNGVGAGTATVTLSVSDGQNPAVSTAFGVLVNAPNNNPTILNVSPQSVNVGSSLSVAIQASDPDGDSITLLAVSDNPAVVTANAPSAFEVIITGVTPGAANVAVEASDGKGGVAATSFTVQVVGVNTSPVIQPIDAQALNAGEQISVGVSIFDADGDLVVLTALSQNSGVVTAESFGTDTIVLTGVGAGVADVNVTADDARGGITTISFSVSVSSPPPTFDLMTYPVLPDISPAMAQSMQQIYQSAVNNFGAQGGAFSKVGGAGVASSNFLAPFASGQPYDLGSYGSVQNTINVYSTVSVRPAIDPAINSLNVGSMAASTQEFNIDTLITQVVLDPACQEVASTPLACEFIMTKPAIALISFDASNVIYMDPSVFRSTLQSLISATISNHGVIPVLATIPATNSVSSDQLTEYNRAIVEVATQFGGTGVPLWNLWRAMQERGISDPFSVAPEGAAYLTDGALAYGYNLRNLSALQVLAVVRQAAGIN
jgi:hypothetical protein